MFHHFVKYGLFIMLTALIAGDFLYQYEWMSWYIQFGPTLLFWSIVILVALFESSSNDNTGEKVMGDDYISRNVFMLTYILGVSIVMRGIFGQPEMSVFDHQSFSFWFFYLSVVTGVAYNVWKYRNTSRGLKN